MKRSFYVAGVQFRPRHDIDSAVKLMNVGDQLGLVPEPKNKFDPNAVKIIAEIEKEEYFLGYVPKKFSSEISALMEIGGELKCVVEAVNPDAKAWEKIKVAIIDEEEAESYIEEEDVI
ncbi:MAG: HIRAN domain-containing protein [Candidatus Izemoplasmatales bacterium]